MFIDETRRDKYHHVLFSVHFRLEMETVYLN